MRQLRRGMTLIEVMVAGAIAFLISMMIFYVILPSFRIVSEGQILTELQQQGELALQQLTADLQNTVPTGTSLAFPTNATEGMITASHPVTPVLGSGILNFQPQLLIWYHNVSKKQLFRKRFSNGDPSGVALSFLPAVALQTTRPNLDLICNQTNGTEKSYAKNVESFWVEKEYTSGGEVYVSRIVLQKDIPGKNKKSVVELFRKAMLRNHY